jgi:penicillin-binding protein 1C
VKRVAGCLLLVAGVVAWIRLGTIPPDVLDQSRFASTTIVDRHGVVLYEPLAKTGTRGERVTSLPENIVRATIAAEDRRFYRHFGVDSVAIVRAVVHDIRAREFVEGGSTITQQVAKLLLQSPDRSILQKGRETILALRLEHRYSKAEIMAMYLTLAPYGNRITGITRASLIYFGCDPQRLTVAQAAYLAGLPQRPNAVRTKYAESRQRYVLSAMHALKTAFDERLQFSARETAVIAQHFVERILSSLGPLPGLRPPSPRGAGRGLIGTSLDADLQRDVIGIIAANRERLLKHGAHSVAVAVMDNRTGEWLAWEGSGDYFGETFGGAIDGVVTLRQPGSTLKPFTYALAFEEGFTPATVLPDVPSTFPTAEGGIVYEPRNYDGRYRGPLRVRSALAGSENVPAVAMLSRVGAPALLRMLRGAGFTDFTKTADYYGLGLTLGDAEVRLDQLVAAYAMFARGGITITNRRLVSQRTAFWISDILSDRDAREFVFGSGGSLDFPFRVAVKTGTSQAYRDNWTIGFTRDVTVGVWVGNFDRSELRNSSGVTGAAPIFHSVMLAAVKRTRGMIPAGDDDPIVEPPSDIERLPICGVSGARPSTHCPLTQNEWLPKSAPVQFCSWHHDGYVDWPVEYRQWNLECGAHGTALRAAARPPHSRLKVTNPPNGATYLIDPTLRSEFQMLKLRATSNASWRVDGRRVSNEWPLKPGEHIVEAIDRDGNRDKVKIRVR